MGESKEAGARRGRLFSGGAAFANASLSPSLQGGSESGGGGGGGGGMAAWWEALHQLARLDPARAVSDSESSEATLARLALAAVGATVALCWLVPRR